MLIHWICTVYHIADRILSFHDIMSVSEKCRRNFPSFVRYSQFSVRIRISADDACIYSLRSSTVQSMKLIQTFIFLVNQISPVRRHIFIICISNQKKGCSGNRIIKSIFIDQALIHSVRPVRFPLLQQFISFQFFILDIVQSKHNITERIVFFCDHTLCNFRSTAVNNLDVISLFSRTFNQPLISSFSSVVGIDHDGFALVHLICLHNNTAHCHYHCTSKYRS